MKLPHINWSYPDPRIGFKGFIDKLVGPGATKAELWIQFVFAIGMSLAMLNFALTKTSWNGWQIAITTYLMFDLCGGIATNATNAAKRWWHRAERRHFKNDFVFLLAHFYMPLLITLFFFPTEWIFFITSYLYLIIVGSLVATSPIYLRRPLALIAYVGGIFLSFTFTLPPGLDWFLPLFYLKLLVSHLPLEAPWQSKS